MEGLKRIKKDISFSLAVVEEKKGKNLGLVSKTEKEIKKTE